MEEEVERLKAELVDRDEKISKKEEKMRQWQQNIKDRMAQGKASLDAKEKETKECHAAIDDLKQQLAAAESRVQAVLIEKQASDAKAAADQSDELTDLMAAITGKDKQIRKLAESESNLSSTVRELKEELLKSAASRERVSAELEELRSRSEDQIQRLSEELASQSGKMQEQVDELTKHRDELADLQQMLASREQMIGTLQADMEQARSAAEETAAAALESKDTELERLQAIVDEKEGEAELSVMTVQQLEAEVTQLKESAKAIEEQSAEKESGDAAGDVQSLQLVIDEQAQRLASLESERDDRVESSAIRIRELETDLASALQEAEETKSALEQVRRQSDDKDRLVEDLQSKLQERAAALDAAGEKARESLEEAHRRLAEAGDATQALRSSMSALEEANKALAAENETLVVESDERQASALQLAQQLADLRKSHEAAVEDLEKAHSRVAETENELAESNAQVAELEETSKLLSSGKEDEHSSALQVLQEERNTLSEQLAESNAKVAELEETSKLLASGKDEHASALQALQEEKQALSQELADSNAKVAELEETSRLLASRNEDEHASTLQALQEEKQALSQELAESKAKVAELEESSKALASGKEDEHASALQALQDEREALRQELAGLRASHEAATEDLEKASTQAADLMRQVEDSKASIAELRGAGEKGAGQASVSQEPEREAEALRAELAEIRRTAADDKRQSEAETGRLELEVSRLQATGQRPPAATIADLQEQHAARMRDVQAKRNAAGVSAAELEALIASIQAELRCAQHPPGDAANGGQPPPEQAPAGAGGKKKRNRKNKNKGASQQPPDVTSPATPSSTGASAAFANSERVEELEASLADCKLRLDRKTDEAAAMNAALEGAERTVAEIEAAADEDQKIALCKASLGDLAGLLGEQPGEIAGVDGEAGREAAAELGAQPGDSSRNLPARIAVLEAARDELQRRVAAAAAQGAADKVTEPEASRDELQRKVDAAAAPASEGAADKAAEPQAPPAAASGGGTQAELDAATRSIEMRAAGENHAKLEADLVEAAEARARLLLQLLEAAEAADVQREDLLAQAARQAAGKQEADETIAALSSRLEAEAAKRAELEAELGDLKEALAAAQTRVDDSRVQTDKLESEAAEVGSQLQAAEEERAALKARCDELEGETELSAMAPDREEELQVLQQEADALKAQLTEAKSQLQAADEERTAIKARCDELEGEAELSAMAPDREEELKVLRQGSDALQTQLTETKSQLQAAEEERTALKARCDELEGEAELSAMAPDREEELKVLQQEADALQAQLTEAKSRLQTAEEERTAIKARCDELEGEAELSAMAPDREEELKILQQDADAREMQLTEAKSQLQAADEERTALKARCDELEGEAELSAMAPDRDQELKILQKETDALQTQLTEAKSQLQGADEERTALKARCDELEGEAELSAMAPDREQELKILQEETDALQTQLTEAKSQLQAADEERNALKARCDELEGEAELAAMSPNTSDELKVLQQELDALRVQLTEAQAEAQRQQSTAEAALRDLEAKQEEYSALEVSLKESDESLATSAQQLAALEAELEELRPRAESLQAEKRQLEEACGAGEVVAQQLREAESAAEQLRNEVAGLRKAEEELQATAADKAAEAEEARAAHAAELASLLHRAQEAEANAASLAAATEAQMRQKLSLAEAEFQEQIDSLTANADDREGVVRLRLEKEWRSRLKAKDTELQDLQHQLDRQAEQAAASQAEVASLVGRLEAAEQAREAAEKRTDDERRETLDLRQTLDAERLRRAQAEADAQACRSRAEEEEEKVRAQHMLISREEEDRRSRELEFKAKHQDELLSLQEQNANLQSVVERLEADAGRVHQRHAAVLNAKDRESDAVKRSLASAGEKVEELEAALEEALRARTELHTKAAALDEQVSQLRAEQRLREEALDVFYKESQQRDRFLELETTVKDLTESLEDTTGRLKDEEHEREVLQNALQARVEELAASLAARESLLEQRTQRMKQAELAVKELQKQNEPGAPPYADRRSAPAATTPVIGHAVTIDEDQPQQHQQQQHSRGGFTSVTRRPTLNSVIFVAIFLLVLLGFYNSSRC
ncbi:hypothetical protein DIPPA_08469 [Diplonema papillatum]|nr:hypothetical protein DIPPA_08469 [Diplonema papillatum]KAJ9467355.1 hypothetical protein DIPPA_08469 [Diplonema papillatum]